MNLEKSIFKIVPYVPRQLIPIGIRILCWSVGLTDNKKIQKSPFSNLPPPALRFHVHGSPFLDSFLSGGKHSIRDLEKSLVTINKDLNSFKNILDFGCGCGRSLIWLRDRNLQCKIYGTDIDEEAISWCKKNLDFVRFDVNKPLPPLEYPSNTFDLVYAGSVFTHLNEDYQYRWLEELNRVTMPKGIVVITIHGIHAYNIRRRQDVKKDVSKEGIVFEMSNTWEEIFPAWYQSTYHTKEYIYDNFSKYFDVLEYIPRGMGGIQDIIILQKREN